MKDSKFQKAIYAEVENGKEHVVISAVAGSGKTTTIINCLSRIPKEKSKIFVAFNNAIVDELKKKITNPEVVITTMHSICWRALMKHHNYKVKLNNAKPLKIIERQAKLFKVLPKRVGFIMYTVSKLIDLIRHNLIDISDLDMVATLAERYDLDFDEEIYTIAKNTLTLMNKNRKEFDFTDMIFRIIEDDVTMPKFEFVFVDESQDLSKLQHQIIKKLVARKGRMIAVGDPHQCQPVGTKVMLLGGISTNIENLKIGDKVVSYDKDSGGFVGYRTNPQSIKYCKKIEHIESRQYYGNIINIKTLNNSSSYTPEHKCVLKFREDTYKQKYVIYLMNRATDDGEDWRIGKTKLYDHNGGSFGPRVRLRSESGDNIWILKVCRDNSEAIIWEEIFATKYGISQKCFTVGGNDNKSFGILENVDFVFKKIRKYVNIRIDILFEDLQISKKHPFLSKSDKSTHYSKLHMFQCFASNLFIIKDIIDVLEIDEKGCKKWSNIIGCKIKKYNGLVYSLKVEKHELYVADNILTHNSIYGFAGADANSYNNLRNLFKGTVELPLSVNYRCGTDIVEHAKEINPVILPFKKNPKGLVKESTCKTISDGDWVLCRNVKPLIVMNLYFLIKGQKSFVRGKDIGKGLEVFIKKMNCNSISSLLKKIDLTVGLEVNKMKAKGVRNPQNTEKIDRMVQRTDAIKILSKNVSSVSALVQFIRSVFKDEGEGVCLSTIHKSKGLENDNIFILCPELIPSKYATQPWQLEQESNLDYVARTRAKKELHYITDYIKIEAEITKLLKDE